MDVASSLISHEQTLTFRKLSSIYVFSYFPFGFEGRIWDLIVSVPDHCLSFCFSIKPSCCQTLDAVFQKDLFSDYFYKI